LSKDQGGERGLTGPLREEGEGRLGKECREKYPPEGEVLLSLKFSQGGRGKPKEKCLRSGGKAPLGEGQTRKRELGPGILEGVGPLPGEPKINILGPG